MQTAKTLIRLGGCPGCSESSLGAHSFCWFCHVAAHVCYTSQLNIALSCCLVLLHCLVALSCCLVVGVLSLLHCRVVLLSCFVLSLSCLSLSVLPCLVTKSCSIRIHNGVCDLDKIKITPTNQTTRVLR